MEDRRTAIVKHIFDILIREGFKVSDPSLGSSPSFDIIARREDLKLVIKILQNIDTLRSTSAAEMIRISKLTYAIPLVVGEKAGGGPLERGVVYFRHKVPILSPDSFYDYVGGEQPFISSGPGGYYASINGKKLQERRMQMGFSIGYLSKKIGTSRRSISLYESGSAVTIDIFLKLEEVLDEDLGKSIDLIEVSKFLEMPMEDSVCDSEFLKEVLDLMVSQGFDMHPVKKSPFDAIMNVPVEEFSLIGLLETLTNRINRISAMRNISEIFENESFIISKMNTEKELLGGCPVIRLSELRKMDDSEDLKILIEKRKSA